MSSYLLRGASDDVIYEGRIRSGSFGRWSPQSYRVRLHVASDTAYLDPFPAEEEIEALYVSGEYREQYNDSAEVDKFVAAYDQAQGEIVSRLDLHALRGSVIADFGCGGGSFLDMVSGFVAESIAVEPNLRFQPRLAAQGHEVYSWGEDLISKRGRCLDWAFSFQVIEHLPDPVDFLRTMAAATRPGGRMVLMTPNRHEVLGRVGIPEYDPFRYRTVHLWYFSERSFRVLAEDLGLEVVRICGVHRYDAANLVRWLRERRPTGCGGMESVFDASFEAFLRGWLESKGMADSLWIELRVP